MHSRREDEVDDKQRRRRLANAIRALTMDAVQANKSGHPGTAMGMADIAEVVWNDFLRHNPANPGWSDRDRFVQSNGHGSMLTYSLLHLAGYDLSLADLRAHRNMGSKTPGHPERGITPGVEITTGPLGQGFASAVGMALAERKLAEEFNRPGLEIVDHRTWVFAGDGCLMEGISQEAASLAGTLKLGKLIVIYDDNNISIDGEVGDWFAEDTPKRFEALGWHVVPGVDGHDAAAIGRALEEASADDRPSIVCCRTIIGYGSPNKQGKEESHGAPLGDAEVALTREALGWAHAPFELPDDVVTGWNGRDRGRSVEGEWDALFARYRTAHPDLAAEFERRMSGAGPEGLDALVDEYAASLAANPPGRQPLRKASSKVVGALSKQMPELIGGAADLAQSTLAWTGTSRSIRPGDFSGNFVHYGVREFAMSAMMNGMAAHGGLTPYGATYLVFSDYARNAVRLASLMKLRSIFVYTHDSIGVGEDGPTHQPSEQILALRAIPSMSVWRPGSELEALAAWDAAVTRDGPSAIVLSRQDCAPVAHGADDLGKIRHGGYVLSDDAGAQIVLAATGSELALVVEAAEALRIEGLAVRVVSIPNGNIFAAQDQSYIDAVLTPGVPKLFVEAGSTLYWYRFLRGDGAVLGIDTFGESAPGPQVFAHFGLTAERIASEARRLAART